jgi:hypothetical protein
MKKYEVIEILNVDFDVEDEFCRVYIDVNYKLKGINQMLTTQLEMYADTETEFTAVDDMLGVIAKIDDFGFADYFKKADDFTPMEENYIVAQLKRKVCDYLTGDFKKYRLNLLF